MADPVLEYFDQRAALVKLEAVAGTDPVLDPATDGILLRDGSSGTEHDKVERNVDRPFMGGRSFTPGNHRAFIEGKFDILAAAAPGAAGATGSMGAERLLLPAGFAVTRDLANKVTRYNPISRNIPAAWSRWYHNGTLRNIRSGKHNLTGVSAAIGATFEGTVRMQGVYDGVPEAVMPAVPTLEVQPPVISWDNAEAFLTVIGGTVVDLPLWARSLGWDLGGELGTTQFTSKQVTGHRNRNGATGRITLIRPRDSDCNLHALQRAGAMLLFTLRVWDTPAKSGFWVEHAVRMQIDTIGEEEVEGYAGYNLSGPMVPSSAGGDECHIACGDDS